MPNETKFTQRNQAAGKTNTALADQAAEARKKSKYKSSAQFSAEAAAKAAAEAMQKLKSNN